MLAPRIPGKKGATPVVAVDEEEEEEEEEEKENAQKPKTIGSQPVRTG